VVCRAGVVALVCKLWSKVERESPHQPTHIIFGREQLFSQAALLWLLRDTSKLLKVALHGDLVDWGYFHQYWENIEWKEAVYCTQSLLTHLAGMAPALRALIIQPPRAASKGRDLNLLPLLGGLTQLERLTILDWGYFYEDIFNFRQLGNLPSLKVLFRTFPAASVTSDSQMALYK